MKMFNMLNTDCRKIFKRFFALYCIIKSIIFMKEEKDFQKDVMPKLCPQIILALTT